MKFIYKARTSNIIKSPPEIKIVEKTIEKPVYIEKRVEIIKEVPVIQEKLLEKIIYIDKPIEVIKEIEKLVEVPIHIFKEIIKEVPVIEEKIIEKFIEVEKPIEKLVYKVPKVILGILSLETLLLIYLLIK